MTRASRRKRAAPADRPIPAGAQPRVAALYAGAASVALVLALAGGVVVAAHRFGVTYGAFTRDPDAVSGEPFYVGAFSMVGLMAWAVAAATAALAALVLWTRPPRKEVVAFAAAAVFAVMLAFDDAFQFHEVVFPDYLGVPQSSVYATYLLLAGVGVVCLRPLLTTTAWPLLVLSGAAFAGSMLMDVVIESGGLPVLAEDSLKLLGIVAWSAYLGNTALIELRARVTSP